MVNEALGRKAKEKLTYWAGEVDKRLEKYWEQEEKKNFGFNETQKTLVKKMLEHAKEHCLRPAKRLRASLVMEGYLLGQKEEVVDERLWRVAEAVEIVHTALLMHDDFMDRDLKRRGLPTTQVFWGEGDEHYGETMAVNLGDAVLCLGYERLLECGFEGEVLKRVMKQVLRGVAETAWGQAYDVSLPKLGEITEEKVISLHKAKTAIYTYENPLLIGGILAGLTEEQLKILRNYAMEVGVAFQLQDDILGVYGSEKKTGKSNSSDLRQGKVTLLIVKVLEKGTDEQKEAVLRVWGRQKAEESEVERAKEAIKASGAYQYSLVTAREYAEKAVITSRKLRETNLNTQAIDYLEGIAEYIVDREV